MRRRLQTVYWMGILITLIMSLAAVGLAAKLKIDDARSHLSAMLRAASMWTLDSNDDLKSLAGDIASVSAPMRVTFLMDTGFILADSLEDANPDANHYDDPEIAAARRGEVGRDLRVSATRGSFVLYMAQRVGPQLILRVSYPVLEIARILVSYAVALTALFGVLYLIQRRGIARFAADQGRQLEDIRRLLDGELARVEAVFPEFQPYLDAISYRIQRLREDHAQIVQTMNLRSDFVANASHELRSPLTSVRGFAEMLKEDMASSEEERALCLEMIVSECDRMLAVIEDILKLSRAERSGGAAPLCEVRPVAEEVCRALMPQAAKKGIRLSVEGACRVPLGEGQVWEVLYNLLDNAVRYGREGGFARAVLSPGRVAVEDDGVGIGPEHVGRVFEQFYRVDEAREAGGSGLGLSIVKALVEGAGGRVRVKSEPGAGSRFIAEFSSEGKT